MYRDRQSAAQSTGDRPLDRSVLIVGAGALGCPAAATLARARVPLTIVDFDSVALANLPSQFLYTEADVGRPKAEAAAERLCAAGADVTPIVERFGPRNADALVAGHAVIVDACDSPATKLALNAAALRAGRPLCYGGVSRTGGLVLSVEPYASACLECVFGSDGLEEVDGGGVGAREHAPDESAPLQPAGCHETGVLAPVAGVLGTLQAFEALGALGAGGCSWHPGRLAVYELRGRRWRFSRMPRDPRCAACAGEPTAASPRRTESCRI